MMKTVGTAVAGAVGLGQHMVGTVTGGGVSADVFSNALASLTAMRSLMDPTRTVLGAPDQGVFTMVHPPARLRRPRMVRGRRSRRGMVLGYPPPPEYTTIATAVPPATNSVQGGYRPGLGSGQIMDFINHPPVQAPIAPIVATSVGTDPDPVAAALANAKRMLSFRFTP